MAVWTRPSGTTIELLDTPNMVEFAEARGWTEDKPDKPKRKRRTKAEMLADSQ